MRQDAGYSEPFMRRAKDVQDAWKDHPLIGGSDGLNTGLYAEDEEEEDVALEPDTYDDDALLPDARPADEGDAVLVSGDDARLSGNEPGGPSPQSSAETVPATLSTYERNGHAELVMRLVYASRLEELEATIREHEEGFFKVAEAFHEIRSKELYKPGFASFDRYIQARWSGFEARFTRSRIYQFAQAGKVLSNISSGSVVQSTNGRLESALGPSNERQARELAKAPEEMQIPVMELAIKIATEEPPPKGKAAEFHVPGRVSTRHIEMAREQLCPTPKPAATSDFRSAPEPQEDAVADISILIEGLNCPSATRVQYDWKRLTIWSGNKEVWITAEELRILLGGTP